MKKFLIYFLTPLITVLLVLLKINYIDSILKNNIGKSASDIIGIILAGLSLYIYYFNIILPHISYERIAKSRWIALNETINSFIEDYSEFFELNVSIMIPKSKRFIWIEPAKNDKSKKKLSIKTKIFKTVWQDEHNPLDQRFRFTINQGLCGMVYKSGSVLRGVVLVPPHNSNYDFNFTTEQQEYIKDLVILVSCPINIFEHGNDGSQRKTLGVINLESRTKGAEQWLLEKKKKDAFFSSILSLEKLVRNLL